MIERLQELMRIKKLSPAHLADAIGVQRSGISHFVSGRNKPSLEFILKILDYFPDINPDWLLFGKEPVFRSDAFSWQEKSLENQKVFKNSQVTENDRVNKNDRVSENEMVFNNEKLSANDLFSGKELSAESRPVSDDKPVNRRKTINSAKEPSADDELININHGDDTTEKIVIFYRNRTFREYLPG